VQRALALPRPAPLYHTSRPCRGTALSTARRPRFADCPASHTRSRPGAASLQICCFPPA
jgi:hypothetical protein